MKIRNLNIENDILRFEGQISNFIKEFPCKLSAPSYKGPQTAIKTNFSSTQKLLQSNQNVTIICLLKYQQQVPYCNPKKEIFIPTLRFGEEETHMNDVSNARLIAQA